MTRETLKQIEKQLDDLKQCAENAGSSADSLHDEAASLEECYNDVNDALSEARKQTKEWSKEVDILRSDASDLKGEVEDIDAKLSDLCDLIGQVVIDEEQAQQAGDFPRAMAAITSYRETLTVMIEHAEAAIYRSKTGVSDILERMNLSTNPDLRGYLFGVIQGHASDARTAQGEKRALLRALTAFDEAAARIPDHPLATMGG
jgi:chromosome segregation ATPase